MYYKCKHFIIQLLVSRLVFYSTSLNKLWQLFDPNLLCVADRLQLKFGTMYINTWKWNGVYDLRGLRHLSIDKTKCVLQNIYMEYGMHLFGKAIDCHFKNVSADEVRQYIITNRQLFIEINGILLNVNWLHFDTRNTNKLITF